MEDIFQTPHGENTAEMDFRGREEKQRWEREDRWIRCIHPLLNKKKTKQDDEKDFEDVKNRTVKMEACKEF